MGQCYRMAPRDVSGHLFPTRTHAAFESLVAAEWGAFELRRMVAPPRPVRARRNDPSNPVAWAAAAARRVAAGTKPGEVVAGLGDLGVFCVALGSVTLLGASPSRIRHDMRADLPELVPGRWIVDQALDASYGWQHRLRDELEDADIGTLRMWSVALLPVVVDAFARQAPGWWRLRRPRFARFVLNRLADPDY